MTFLIVPLLCVPVKFFCTNLLQYLTAPNIFSMIFLFHFDCKRSEKQFFIIIKTTESPGFKLVIY